MQIGRCIICGRVSPLTIEHVPPRSAFNDQRVVLLGREQSPIDLGPDDELTGKIQQGGFAYTSLCESCNNNTGSWYGSAYKEWAAQGHQILTRSGGHPSLYHPYIIYPLRVIKQVIAMFMSINTLEFRDRNEALAAFILNREAQSLPEGYRIFTCYNIGYKFRHVPITLMSQLNPVPRSITLSEITTYPFTYVLTIGSPPPDDRLFEITHFANYSFTQSHALNLKLETLPALTFFPGDYRTRREIYNQTGIEPIPE